MQLEVGKSYIWKGKTVKLTAKWAQGKWFKYTFDDGSSFYGDPLPMVNSGELKIHISEQLPPTKMRPEIIKTPDWFRKKDDGKTPKS